MGGPYWTEEEDDDLKTMDPDEFMAKWNRSRPAMYTRRQKLGIIGHRGMRIVTRSDPALAPLCVYCSSGEGECTCVEGHRCRDPLCLYSKRR